MSGQANEEPNEALFARLWPWIKGYLLDAAQKGKNACTFDLYKQVSSAGRTAPLPPGVRMYIKNMGEAGFSSPKWHALVGRLVGELESEHLKVSVDYQHHARKLTFRVVW